MFAYCLYAVVEANFFVGRIRIIDTEKTEEKAVRERIKSRRYVGKYNCKGKYKQKTPHNKSMSTGD